MEPRILNGLGSNLSRLGLDMYHSNISSLWLFAFFFDSSLYTISTLILLFGDGSHNYVRWLMVAKLAYLVRFSKREC